MLEEPAELARRTDSLEVLALARPLTRDQQLQNRAFLKALRETGNIRLAARRVGLAVSTMHHRRGAHPVFAQGWAAAVAYADASASMRRFAPGLISTHIGWIGIPDRQTGYARELLMRSELQRFV